MVKDATVQRFRLACRCLAQASEELTIAINSLNDSIQSIGPGVSAWVTCQTCEDWSLEVGYAMNSKHQWALAVRRNSKGSPSPEEWPLTEAPRWMRVVVIPKLPELIDHLSAQAEKFTTDLLQRVPFVQAIIDSMDEKKG